ncbi:MAG: bifunctional UDP-N-acetylglucosamine diphosphorylase/glucosamine-1-phosphate N-acetyltransferase GlmU [Bdellovibrionales bacterium]|nr:bifunctional UDP-N-acetylglucosamine diphosphorylase/glucosamine-1-phosphate N-acetyltransferase GlmU [Bdellovibrionales bacterium]
MMKKAFTAIVLAAGQGTRMKSPLPKVLHPVAGIPMISRVIGALKEAGATEIRVVVGHSEELVRRVVEPLGAICFRQTEQKGTADAVKAAEPEDIQGPVLIVNGDHPLITAQDVLDIFEDFHAGRTDLSVVTANVKNPKSLGRIVRSGGELQAIVEAKDASAETLKIKEINVAIYVMMAEILSEFLPQINSNNAQKEFYLTDIVALAKDAGKNVGTITVKKHVAHGVNSQAELAQASRFAFHRKATQLMDSGVVFIDPKNCYVEESVEIGEASVIYPGVYLRGTTKLGKFCMIEPHAVITDSQLSDSVRVLVGSCIEGTVMKNHSEAGPYARLRPGTVVGEEAKIGNFVEMKNTHFHKGAKAGHLTYLGDAEVGENTNIGCGTITCNYAVDRKKYKTIIGKDVFVGSDTQFVAPITIGDHAVVASGSTITKDVPASALAVARGKQFIKENYKPKGTSAPLKDKEPSSDQGQ